MESNGLRRPFTLKCVAYRGFDFHTAIILFNLK